MNSMGKLNSVVASNTGSFGIPAENPIRNSKPDQQASNFEGSHIMSETD